MTHSQETPDQSQKAEPLPETREPLKAYQRLSEKIQDAIEKGGLKVGDKLPPERALAETFGVSRNSVREAIRTLSEQGILKSRHGDGTYICGSDLAPLTAALLNAVDTEGKSFDHIMEFRLVIEPSIARIATARHSAEQLHQLKIIVCDQQLKLLHGENDGELDAQFHTLLASRYSSIWDAAVRSLRTSYQSKDFLKKHKSNLCILHPRELLHLFPQPRGRCPSEEADGRSHQRASDDHRCP